MDEVLLAVESSDPVVARMVAFLDQGLGGGWEVACTEAEELGVHRGGGEEAVGLCDEVRVAAEEREIVVTNYMVGACRHAATFCGVTADEEHGHEVHELFRSYEEVFEDVIAAFLRQEQLSADEFFAHCRVLQRSPKHEDATGNLQLLLSALDFEAFCDLMTQEAVQTQLALKAAEDMGL